MEFIIEKATIDDIPTLIPLINDCFGNDTSSWSSVSNLIGGVRITPEALQKEMNNPGITFLKCEDPSSGKLVASCRAHILMDPNSGENVIYSEMLCVSAAYQGKGLAKLMVERVEEIGVELKCKLHKIQVFSCRQPLIEWYAKLGFKNNDRPVKMPTPSERSWFPKVDNLVLIEMEKGL